MNFKKFHQIDNTNLKLFEITWPAFDLVTDNTNMHAVSKKKKKKQNVDSRISYKNGVSFVKKVVNIFDNI